MLGELYAKNDVKAFEIITWNGTARSSAMDIELIHKQFANDPASADGVNMAVIQKNLVDKFYSLLPPQQADFANVPMIVEFQPQASYYVIKSLSRNLPNQAEYDQDRAKIAYSLDYIDGQSMAMDFLLPDNILNRMEFKWAVQDEADDANSIEEASGDMPDAAN